MLEQPMIEKLLAMRLHGIVEALRRPHQAPASAELGFSERLALRVDQQSNWKENQALTRCLTTARGLDAATIAALPWREKDVS